MDFNGKPLIVLKCIPLLTYIDCSGFSTSVYILTLVNSVLLIHNMYLFVITNDMHKELTVINKIKSM